MRRQVVPQKRVRERENYVKGMLAQSSVICTTKSRKTTAVFPTVLLTETRAQTRPRGAGKGESARTRGNDGGRL